LAGITTIKVTRWGRIWWGLERRGKMIALPGIIIGLGLGILFIPALIAFYLVLKLLLEPYWERLS
jgi:hypothetical protein